MQVNQVSYQNHKSNPSFQQIRASIKSKEGTKVFNAVAGALTYRKRGKVVPHIAGKLANGEDFYISEITEGSLGHYLRLSIVSGAKDFPDRIPVRNQRGRTLARQIRNTFDQLHLNFES